MHQSSEQRDRRQPNPRYRSVHDLNTRDREHFEIAKALPSGFDRSQFLDRYRSVYPTRNVGSVIPSDYCFDVENGGNFLYPRFLLRPQRNRYQFVGLGRATAQACAVTSLDIPHATVPPTRPHTGTRGRSGRRFVPAQGISLRLNEEIAFAAIQAYNEDPTVDRQERAAFRAIGGGIEQGGVLRQLRALNSAYSTRCSLADLRVVSDSIELGWREWTRVLEAQLDLESSPPRIGDVRTLLSFFLARPTSRRPRSLATKSMHFASPVAFSPVDTYVADKMGSELRAGSWAQTAGLDHDEMTTWYHDLLQVIYDVGNANRDVIARLLVHDESTGPGEHHARLRGLPKLLDKIFWLAAREERRGVRMRIFES